MKTIALLLLSAAALVPAAQAGTCPPPAPKPAAYCPPAKPAYAYTKKLATRTECRWYTDKCGKRVSYEVTYITYADYFTDGSRHTYTKEIRA
jgi:hypothetical protein